jgi:hypothetical protein
MKLKKAPRPFSSKPETWGAAPPARPTELLVRQAPAAATAWRIRPSPIRHANPASSCKFPEGQISTFTAKLNFYTGMTKWIVLPSK